MAAFLRAALGLALGAVILAGSLVFLVGVKFTRKLDAPGAMPPPFLIPGPAIASTVMDDLNTHHPGLSFLNLFLAGILLLAGAVMVVAIVYGQTSPCTQSLSGAAASGQFSTDCPSALHSGKYSRYYAFTVGSQARVTVTLTSQDTDTYLYLYPGTGNSGTVLHENDDIETGVNRNSRISAALPAGAYTIEATTHGTDQTGTFTLRLTISGQDGSPSPGSGAAASPVRSGPKHVCVLRSAGDVLCYPVANGVYSSATVRLVAPPGDPLIAFDTGNRAHGRHGPEQVTAPKAPGYKES